MKIIDKDRVQREDSIESLKKEISILMMADHQNIVKLIEVLASRTKIYLVLEFIKGGELWYHISKNYEHEKYFKFFISIKSKKKVIFIL